MLDVVKNLFLDNDNGRLFLGVQAWFYLEKDFF